MGRAGLSDGLAFLPAGGGAASRQMRREGCLPAISRGPPTSTLARHGVLRWTTDWFTHHLPIQKVKTVFSSTAGRRHLASRHAQHDPANLTILTFNQWYP